MTPSPFPTELVRQFPDNPYLDLEHAGILIKTRQYSAAYDHAQAILEKVTSKTRNYDPVTELGALLFMVESDFRRQSYPAGGRTPGADKKQPCVPEQYPVCANSSTSGTTGGPAQQPTTGTGVLPESDLPARPFVRPGDPEKSGKIPG